MSTFHRRSAGGIVVSRLLQSAWRYKWLIVAAVLLGALLGYGWASRQPTLYEGVSRVLLANRCPPHVQCPTLPSPAQLMRSSAVLERAVKLSGSRISADTLGQRLQVDAAQDTDLVTIRVVDSTATGAAQLADSVMRAYDRVATQQSRKVAAQLLRERGEPLTTSLARVQAELAGRPNDDRLRKQLEALSAQLADLRRLLAETRTAESILLERAVVPDQPIQPRPGRTMAIGMLLGLLASAVLVWWRTRRQGPTAPAPEQGPEMPSSA
jgi:uncharacterized protein involved in exopolysaccharide biosynthesis